MTNQPLISVVMPVYNRAQYVAEAITSILGQTYSHFEFIVADDGSTDDTPRLIREFAARDARIRPIFLPHGGGRRAANAGVAQARGELIARMDSDDIALPQRFAAQLAWMRRNDLDLCGASVLFFGDATGPVWFPETHDAIRRELLFRVGMLHPTVIARADILRANPYDESVHHEDYELWTRLAPHYRMGNVPQLLLKHRNHDQQTRVLEAAELRQDLRTYRRRAFQDLFPNATEQEWQDHLTIAEKQPFDHRAALERAGAWLVKLANVPDPFLGQKMAIRWRMTCHASARLGLNSYRLYRQYLPQMTTQDNDTDRALWFACALHLAPDSRITKSITRIKRALHHQNK